MASLVPGAGAGDVETCPQLVAEHHADMIRAAYVVTGDGEGLATCPGAADEGLAATREPQGP